MGVMCCFGGNGGIRVRTNKTQPGRPHMMLSEESSTGQSLMRGQCSLCNEVLGIIHNYSTYSTSKMVEANETRSTELAVIISYPTSASGIIILLKTPTKYRECFPTLFVNQPIFILFLILSRRVQLPYF